MSEAEFLNNPFSKDNRSHRVTDCKVAMGHQITKAIIFDIDGTLANCDHRRHFLQQGKKDFKAFYEAMEDDTPNQDIVDLCRLHIPTHHIVICTGRPETYRDITEKWLAENRVPYFHLLMRPTERQYDKDSEVKRDMLHWLIKQGFEIVMTVDDRDQVVKMWRTARRRCFLLR